MIQTMLLAYLMDPSEQFFILLIKKTYCELGHIHK